jgi:glucan phosphoethanolaminetransferase (alkaline phosphatase superfamily)
MLKRLRPHIYLALTFFTLTLGQQYAFYAYKGLPIEFFTPGKYLVIFLFFLVLTFVKGNTTRFLCLSLIMILNFFQMGHLSYFGTQILPTEYWFVLTQFYEIRGTLKEDLSHVYIPLLFTLLPLAMAHFVYKKARPVYGHRIMVMLLGLYLIYNPIRTYITGNTWGRQPSTRELTGMNLYLTFSYFLGRILPHKLSAEGAQSSDNSSLQLKLEKGEPSNWDKIIIIIGESLTPRHMGLFGYERPTTPFLDGLKNDPSFFATKGLSGGVSTDISVAYFLNLGFGGAGAIKTAKGEQCLFKLAKQGAFNTHFLSIQSSDQLRYITPYLCSSSLDDYRSLEDISPGTQDHQAARDRDLLNALAPLLEGPSKKLIVLHQRGSHSPWNLRHTADSKRFKGAADQRVDDYDNSVLEFDFFWKDLTALIKRSQQRILVLYTSDHGEALGDEGRWGHGFIHPISFEVPILALSHGSHLPHVLTKMPKYMTHFNLGILIAEELGLKSSFPVEQLPSDYEIYGNDIDGFAGKALIKWGQDQSEYTFDYLP